TRSISRLLGQSKAMSAAFSARIACFWRENDRLTGAANGLADLHCGCRSDISGDNNTETQSRRRNELTLEDGLVNPRHWGRGVRCRPRPLAVEPNGAGAAIAPLARLHGGLGH